MTQKSQGLLASGIDANSVDDNGSTSLHVASLFGYSDIAKRLWTQVLTPR